MDIFDTLDALETQMRESPWIPFTRLRAVDLDLINELLRIAREQLEQARQQASSESAREEALNQAGQEGRLIVEAARQESQEILNEDRVRVLSQRNYDAIVGEGHQRADEHMRAAYAYTTERMTAVESSLRALRDQVSAGAEAAQKTTRDAEKNLRQRKKEVSREKAKARRQKLKQALF